MGELPDPQPGPRDVLVEVHAVSVTFMDRLDGVGDISSRRPLPFAPDRGSWRGWSRGKEVTRFRTGDRVACG